MTDEPKKTMLGWAAGHDPAEADTDLKSPLPAYLQYSQPEPLYPQATPAQQQQYGHAPAYPPSYGQPSYAQGTASQAQPYAPQDTGSSQPSYEQPAPASQQGYDSQAQSPYAQQHSPWQAPHAQQPYPSSVSPQHGYAQQPMSPHDQAQHTHAQQPAQHGYAASQAHHGYAASAHDHAQAQHGYAAPNDHAQAQHGYAQQPASPHDHANARPGYAAAQHGHAHGSSQQPSSAAPSYGHVAVAAAQRTNTSRSPKRPIAGADATTGVPERVRFIRRTYLHLLGAILAFAGLLYLLMTNETLVTKVSAPLVKFALGGRWNWGVVLLVFMAVSWVADYWASHATSKVTQYLGLGFYVIAEALIFVPLLAIVAWKTQAILAKGGGNPNIIRDSAFVTLGIFTALTASVFITRKDFSFLRSGLVMASGAAMMLIILSLTFGFNLGLVFSVAMVLLAAAYILYQTSQVLAHYDPRQHVAASLALFSSVALMFWYVIRIFMRARE